MNQSHSEVEINHAKVPVAASCQQLPAHCSSLKLFWALLAYTALSRSSSPPSRTSVFISIIEKCSQATPAPSSTVLSTRPPTGQHLPDLKPESQPIAHKSHSYGLAPLKSLIPS